MIWSESDDSTETDLIRNALERDELDLMWFDNALKRDELDLMWFDND